MPLFSSALTHWFTQRTAVSLRALATEAKIAPAELSRVRAGDKSITLDTLSKLLPAIERLSSRSEARALLVAYLQDETPEEFKEDIQIRALADSQGNQDKDLITICLERWEARARKDAEFAKWMLTMDGYMHEPDSDVVDSAVEAHTSKMDVTPASHSSEGDDIPSPEQLAIDLGVYMTTREIAGQKVTIYTGADGVTPIAAEDIVKAEAALEKLRQEIREAQDQIPPINGPVKYQGAA